MFKMLKKSQVFFCWIFDYFGIKCRDTSYPSNYQGIDVYGNQWYVGINNAQQLWAIIQDKKIRNAGYFEPYRKNIILSKIINWKNVCHRN